MPHSTYAPSSTAAFLRASPKYCLDEILAERVLCYNRLNILPKPLATLRRRQHRLWP